MSPSFVVNVVHELGVLLSSYSVITWGFRKVKIYATAAPFSQNSLKRGLVFKSFNAMLRSL